MIIMAFSPYSFKSNSNPNGMKIGDCCIAQCNPTSTLAALWYKIHPSRSHPIKETLHMSPETHLAELERRHRALEAEISEALAHPSSDGLKIAELKRRKLQVKDEIARLQQESKVSVH